MPWKCKNPSCGKTFDVYARISVEKRPPPSFSPDIPTRVIVDKACCPFCECTDIELLKEAES